jgi:3-oxoacyl-[acyl-carrier-protein] synthase II
MTRHDVPSVDGGAETIDDAAMGDYLNARRTRRLSEYVKFTLAAATMAVRDSGLAEHPKSLAIASAILGSMHGSARFCYDYYSQIVAEGVLAANPVLFAEGVPNAAAAHLSSTLGIKGACQTIIGSRTAGIDALALGALRVRSGAVDAVIVVAAEAACEVVDRAYEDNGLQACEAIQGNGPARRGFRRGVGGVAFIIESNRAAMLRSARPYARVLGSSWASSPPTEGAGPAGAVTSVLSRLPKPGRVIGSTSNSWVDRAERIGIRKAGLAGERSSVFDGFGEMFSVSPLAALATELIGDPVEPRCSILCTDWSGAASAVTIERLDRRLSAL